ncbi:jg6994 [Pararge aegeria aegeria]|uniref:Jg6994 protein n=1 Tax=Pararge aegeria aegeria TaxID=348720 RepID=A0A8S4SJY7_9NEOP|nr:jg6994 [Pararge aegeria aegeria]
MIVTNLCILSVLLLCTVIESKGVIKSEIVASKSSLSQSKARRPVSDTIVFPDNVDTLKNEDEEDGLANRFIFGTSKKTCPAGKVRRGPICITPNRRYSTQAPKRPPNRSRGQLSQMGHEVKKSYDY